MGGDETGEVGAVVHVGWLWGWGVCLVVGVGCGVLFFFFFKQKTAYEISLGLVGSGCV